MVFLSLNPFNIERNLFVLGGPKGLLNTNPCWTLLTDEGIDKIVLNMLGKRHFKKCRALIESCDVVVTADTGSAYCVSFK